MTCIVCSEPRKYKCAQCFAGYCSVVCYKTHKETCEGAKVEAPAAPAATATTATAVSKTEFNQWLEDPEIKALIRLPSVRQHLKVVADIMQDGRLSGEGTTEGRRAVAVKKLRELRMGGREKNEAIEEFVRLVLSHMGVDSGALQDDK